MALFSMTKDDDYASRKAAIARQEKLAEMLSQMGAQEQAVSTAGGITAPMSGMGALARGLTSFGGSYLSGKAAADAAALDKSSLRDALAYFSPTHDVNIPGASTDVTLDMPTPGNAIASALKASVIPEDFAGPNGQPVDSDKLQARQDQGPRTLEMPDISSAPQKYTLGVGPSTGTATYSPEEQMSRARAAQFNSNPLIRSAAAGEMTQIEAERERNKPKLSAAGEWGMVDSNPNSSTFGKLIIPPTPRVPALAEIEKEGLLAYGPGYKTNPKFIADVTRKLQGLDSDAKVAQMLSIFGQKTAITADARQKQYSLSDPESDALFGPNGAVTRGLINPDRINSRTAHIFAKAAISNPDLNMVNAAGVAALMKNPTFQNKVIVADTIPAIVENVKQAGQKVDFSDINYIGKLQAWEKRQLNDPDFINYIGQRNDAVQSIASVMRGIGMSDKAVELELAAAPLTMSPKAFDAWAEGQLTSLKPRLEKYQGVTLNTSAPGGQRLAAPGQGAAAPGAGGGPLKVRNFNPVTGKIE